MQSGAPPLDKTGGHLDTNLVPPSGAGGNLVKQLRHLRRAGNSGKLALQPVAQQISLARPTQALQTRQLGRRTGLCQIQLGQFDQQALPLGSVGRTAGEGAAELRESRLQHRQQLGPDAVAGVAAVGIARVLNPARATLAQPGAQVGPRHLQQRPVVVEAGTHPSRWHATQTRQPGTSAQGQQQGFDLIVGMLRQRYIFDSYQANGIKG